MNKEEIMKEVEILINLLKDFELSIKKGNNGFVAKIEGHSDCIIFAYYYLKEILNDEDFEISEERKKIIKKLAKSLKYFNEN